MIEIGEDLVGAYLKEVVGCDLVSFNVRTGHKQGEIDVIGLKFDGATVTEVWLCEVTTHTGCMGGYKGKADTKIRTKIENMRAYAERTYPGVARNIEVWSPKVTAAMLSKLEPVLGDNEDVRLVANQDYSDRVRELAIRARSEKAYRDSPSFRLLQILSRLPGNPLG